MRKYAPGLEWSSFLLGAELVAVVEPFVVAELVEVMRERKNKDKANALIEVYERSSRRPNTATN